jgi:hypothetical protein
MKMQAWSTVGKNPSEDPPTTISIAPVEKMTGVFPWLLPLERAVEIFGPEVEKIGPEPQEVFLSLTVKGRFTG